MTTETLPLTETRSNYRWVMLAMCALTPTFVVTLPNLSLPPMFTIISNDLGLSLVQIGTIWGVMIGFAGIFFALIGGTLGDRFGTRRTIVVACLLTGLFGMSRGLAVDFGTLLISSLLFGFAQAIIPVMMFKVARQWFPPERLGMASGVISAGFAGGLTLGPLLSTSLILPALGGWRQVVVFFGGLAIFFAILWLVLHPSQTRGANDTTPQSSLLENVRHVVRLRNVLILGLGGMGISACFSGFTGYLPTYLKAVGWADLDADRALSAFFLMSLISVVPLSILCDRLQLRRGFLIFAACVLATGIGSLALVHSSLVVYVIAATGIVFDAFMAISGATVLEVRGVGLTYAGTALGISTMIRNTGGFFAPPLGNSLAVYGPSVPFLFWGAMGFFAVFMFTFVLKMQPRQSESEALEAI